MRKGRRQLLSFALALSVAVTGISMPERPAKAAAGDSLITEEDGYTAFLMFTDKNWNWGNWAPNGIAHGSNKGWGNDAVITGDGTYTVSIDRKSYEKYLQAEGDMKEGDSAEGAIVFLVYFVGMAEAENLDVSHMQIKDITVRCDGKKISTDESKMYFGHSDPNHWDHDRGKPCRLSLEIRNEYGYDEGEFVTKDEFDKMNPDFAFEDSLSVTFTLEGIQKGSTPGRAFHEYARVYDNKTDSYIDEKKDKVRSVSQWNAGVGYGKDGYTAFLAFGDENWNWGNYGPSALSAQSVGAYSEGWGQDAVITGDGTYTVSIHKEDWDGFAEPASGAMFLNVELVGMAEAEYLDFSQMQIQDVTVECDGKKADLDGVHMYFGDIKGYISTYGSLRLEICNAYGWDEGDFRTKEEFDKKNPNFTFEDSLSVTFTLKGIREGSTQERAFYGYKHVSDPDTGACEDQRYSIVRTLVQGEDKGKNDMWDKTPSPDGTETRAPGQTNAPYDVETNAPTGEPGGDANPTKEPGENTSPTTEPGGNITPTKKPDADSISTKEPEKGNDPTGTATAKPSQSPSASRQPGSASELTPSGTPSDPEQPTKQPDHFRTEVPVMTSAPDGQTTGEPVMTSAPDGQTTATPVTTQTPDGQATAAPTLTAVPQTTATPAAKATATPQKEGYGEPADEGEELEDNSGTTYTVTKSGKKAEAEYTAPKENAKGIIYIPEKVTINGVSYKVTSVADNAFKNNDKVKKIVINKNITSIGSNAFKGCKNLRVITITSTKLTSKSISKNAFKGISGKVVIKVPKGMKKKYKKLFRSKGLSKKVRFI